MTLCLYALMLLVDVMIFPERQLQRKFKHAIDFGIAGDFNASNSAKFRQALQAHVSDNATLTIEGTYRGIS